MNERELLTELLHKHYRVSKDKVFANKKLTIEGEEAYNKVTDLLKDIAEIMHTLDEEEAEDKVTDVIGIFRALLGLSSI